MPVALSQMSCCCIQHPYAASCFTAAAPAMLPALRDGQTAEMVLLAPERRCMEPVERVCLTALPC